MTRNRSSPAASFVTTVSQTGARVPDYGTGGVGCQGERSRDEEGIAGAAPPRRVAGEDAQTDQVEDVPERGVL